MRFVLTGGTVFNRGKLAKADICIGDGLIVPFSAFDGGLPHRVINISNCIIVAEYTIGFKDLPIKITIDLNGASQLRIERESGSTQTGFADIVVK